MHEVSSCGLPHSEIRGSMPICGFPRLIAACRVLRRLPVPRHPPCALLRLTMRPSLFMTFFCFAAHLSCFSQSHFMISSLMNSRPSLRTVRRSLPAAFRFVTIKITPLMSFPILRCSTSFDVLLQVFSYMRFSRCAALRLPGHLFKSSGGHLLCHTVSSAVPSAA